MGKMEGLRKALPLIIPVIAVAGVYSACKYAYKTDSNFRTAVDDLFGNSQSNTDDECCGSSNKNLNCCVGAMKSDCCGSAEKNECCNGNNDEACCQTGNEDQNDCGDCGCGEGLDGHVLTMPEGADEDLEDLKFEFESDDERPQRGIIPKVPKNHKGEVGFLPPIYVKTFGCSHNTSDSEFMAGMLAQHGYPLVNSLEECELTVINSCTVKNPSQDAFVNLVRRAKSMNKKVVVAGCVPQADKEGLDETTVGVSAIGVAHLDRILEVVEETLNGNSIRLLGRRKANGEGWKEGDTTLLPSLDLPKVRRNRFVEIVPLSTGCLGACSYCKTKHARGRLGSYTYEQLIRRVESVLSENVREIWMTSEDTGAWGLDLGGEQWHIGNLLRGVSSLLEQETGAGGVMLRLGMTNPPYMLKHKETLGEVLNHPNVFSFIHIPIQSASNAVLEGMIREYTREEFEELAGYLRKVCPRMTIATDIICGFPGETEEDHQDTLNLIEKWKFPVVNISQFYPRAGTAAAAMKRVDTKIVKRRSGEVTKLFESYSTNDWLENETVDVWFLEHSGQSDHTVGHTKEYIKVLVDRDEALLGQRRQVRINKCLKWHIEGEVLQKNV